MCDVQGEVAIVLRLALELVGVVSQGRCLLAAQGVFEEKSVLRVNPAGGEPRKLVGVRDCLVGLSAPGLRYRR